MYQLSFPKMEQKFIAFSKSSKFMDSDKLLKHKLGSI